MITLFISFVVYFLEDFKVLVILIKKLIMIIVVISILFDFIKLFSNSMIFSEFEFPLQKRDLTLFHNFFFAKLF